MTLISNQYHYFAQIELDYLDYLVLILLIFHLHTYYYALEIPPTHIKLKYAQKEKMKNKQIENFEKIQENIQFVVIKIRRLNTVK